MQHFFSHRGGNIALLSALILPLVLAFVGGGVDFYRWGNQRADLKELSDLLATRGAREFLLANTSAQQIENVLHAAVKQGAADTYHLDNFEMKVDVNMTESSVRVSLTQPAKPGLFLTKFKPYSEDLSIHSTAVARGGMNVCVVALDEHAAGVVAANLNAQMDAPECSIMANSTSPQAITANGAATIRAGLICSAGGALGLPTHFDPAPTTDCPVYQDPLNERQPPSPGFCLETDYELGDNNLDTTAIAAANAVGGVVTDALLNDGLTLIDNYVRYDLQPGTYCGGINIGSNADVHLAPGVYIIKDGPLTVALGGKLTGEDVSFYLVGDDSTFYFDTESKISLSARKDGPLSGILFFEDRHAPMGRTHRILSDDARELLGTFYLPRGALSVASLLPVADRSAYTIIVASQLHMTGSPTLVLNTDYHATDVPPPIGVGPVGGSTFLRE